MSSFRGQIRTEKYGDMLNVEQNPGFENVWIDVEDRHGELVTVCLSRKESKELRKILKEAEKSVKDGYQIFEVK